MTDVQYNASETNLTLLTELSEDHFDFTAQGGNSKLAPFTVSLGIDWLPYLLPNTATLNALASFRPPLAGTYSAIARVHSTKGHQDFPIVGTGV